MLPPINGGLHCGYYGMFPGWYLCEVLPPINGGLHCSSRRPTWSDAPLLPAGRSGVKQLRCALSEPLTFEDYVTSIGNVRLIIDMLVGDLQRVIEYPKLGFAIAQDVPGEVYKAYNQLLQAGYDSRTLKHALCHPSAEFPREGAGQR